jgi:peptidoglycan/LPS O-acetylase OafA/YrhL
MYMLHISAIAGAKRLLPSSSPTLFVFLVALVVTVVLAHISFRLFETPFLKLRKHFAGSR